MKIKKKIGGGGGGSGQGDVTPTKLLSQNIFKESTWGGGQDGCERRIKVFVKIQKKIFFLGGGAGRGGGGGWVGGQM